MDSSASRERRNLASERVPSHFNWPLSSAEETGKLSALKPLLYGSQNILTVLSNNSDRKINKILFIHVICGLKSYTPSTCIQEAELKAEPRLVASLMV